MQKYIHTVIQKIISANTDFNNITIILPSKRAGVFVKNEFKKTLEPLHFLPKIISVENFISTISKIDTADKLVLLFEFYKIYLENTEKEKIESFEDFSNWASILITDFNEIDSYLIDPKYIFTYLKDINRIESWFKKEESKTELTKKYMHFFEKIEVYYTVFYQHLLQLKIGYQGLQYREANQNIGLFMDNNKDQKYIFIGFNALNKVEENIIQELLQNNLADIYFDVDQFFIEKNISAAAFIKNYKNNWNYFTHQDFHSISNDFSKEKNIEVIGVPKNISQIKYATEIIQKNIAKQDNMALVLANEDLLTTVVNSLPHNIQHINITMGLPLKNILYADLFRLLFKLHQNKKKLGNNQKFYHKDVFYVLNHPAISNKFTCEDASKSIVNIIKKKNYIFLEKSILIDICPVVSGKLLELIFSDWNDFDTIIENSITIIQELKKDNENHFDLEYLNRFEQIFIQIEGLNSQYGYVENLDGISSIFTQILLSETLSFKGEALKGLQIMGMLETRVLDFETIILTSVNEGFLPSGKTNNSFIPFDIKNEVGLPTYQEKDAIFSYHFYRLITRAKNIYLLYNTETDDASGEQSRFITQLAFFQNKLPNHHFTQTIVSPKINNEKAKRQLILKNDAILKKLQIESQKGFSPTSLTNYIYNPIAFYKQKILKIYQLDEIEETIATNTMGTVVHRVLEKFYLPFKGKFLTTANIVEMQKNINQETKRIFGQEYKNGDLTKGKNLLIFEVSKQYVARFLRQELQLLKENNQLKIIDLEVDLSCVIHIDGIDFPIKLKGQADRIDELNGTIRIIDYKTGKVEQKQLNINDWDKLLTNHKYSKAFQVLLYAYMYVSMQNISIDKFPLETGIVSFKNLKEGFMKVNNSVTTMVELNRFEITLKNLLQEILNIEIPFVENENLPY